MSKAVVYRPLVTECFKELGSALKQFGTYSFDDKGASEVMDVDELVEKFRSLDVEVAGATLVEIATSPKYDGRGQGLVREILGSMEDWDELFDQPRITEFY